MLFFAIHNKALSDFAYTFSYAWLQSPIESCYVCGGFQLDPLAKKAPGGRSLDMIIYSGSFGEVREE